MANYKMHLDEVEKVKEEVEHTKYRRPSTVTLPSSKS